MPSIYEAEDFETEMIILPQIKDLHKQLLEEEIKQQIRNPFDSKVDFVETFNQQLENALDEEDITEDNRKQIEGEGISFYLGVIEQIDNYFQLECSMETIAEKNLEDIRDTFEAMYSFFVLKRKKNIKNMLLNYILENAEEICKALDYLKEKYDVTSENIKKYVNDENLAAIAANLQEVISYVKSLDNDMAEMITYLDMENFNNAMVYDLMHDCVILANFQDLYFAPLFSYHDSDYDDILAKIEHGIYTSGKKRG